MKERNDLNEIAKISKEIRDRRRRRGRRNLFSWIAALREKEWKVMDPPVAG